MQHERNGHSFLVEWISVRAAFLWVHLCVCAPAGLLREMQGNHLPEWSCMSKWLRHTLAVFRKQASCISMGAQFDWKESSNKTRSRCFVLVFVLMGRAVCTATGEIFDWPQLFRAGIRRIHCNGLLALLWGSSDCGMWALRLKRLTFLSAYSEEHTFKSFTSSEVNWPSCVLIIGLWVAQNEKLISKAAHR